MNSKKTCLRPFIGLLIASLFFSCNSNIDIDPQFQPVLVVDGLFAEGDTIDIDLFQNLSLDDSIVSSSDYYFEKGVSGALVQLYDNDVLVDTMAAGKYACCYTSDVVAAVNHTYKMVVSHPDFPTIESLSTVPVAVPVDSVQYITPTDSVNLKLVVRFTDEATAGNYYIVRFFSMRNGFRKNRSFYNVDPIFGSALEFDFNILGFESGLDKVDKAEITDEQNNGSVITYQALLPIKFEKPLDSNNINLGDTIGVRLYAVNKELYEYNRSIEIYQQSQSSGAQPSGITSNIENGAGLFSGYSVSEYLLVYR